jgi:hypothetical protein
MCDKAHFANLELPQLTGPASKVLTLTGQRRLQLLFPFDVTPAVSPIDHLLILDETPKIVSDQTLAESHVSADHQL